MALYVLIIFPGSLAGLGKEKSLKIVKAFSLSA